MSELAAISLFSGAGGLDLGCEEAGFRTVAAVEIDARARETMAHNASSFFPSLDVDAHHGGLFTDITVTPPALLLKRAGLRRGEAALVHGGPPCVAFSKTGYWIPYKREDRDERATLVDWFAGMVAETQPKTVLMENVFGLIYKRSRHHLDRFLSMMDEAGYEMRHEVLLAADYGVPQIRQRLLCVGIRRDLIRGDPAEWEFPWPEQSHAGPHETRRLWRADLPAHKTAGEALADLDDDRNSFEPEEVVRGTYAEELAADPARRQLPLLDGQARPSRAPLGMAFALLVVSAEGLADRAVAHDPGAARTVGRAISLGRQALSHRRAQAADDVARRLRGAWESTRASAPARERGAASPGAEGGERSARDAP